MFNEILYTTWVHGPVNTSNLLETPLETMLWWGFASELTCIGLKKSDSSTIRNAACAPGSDSATMSSTTAYFIKQSYFFQSKVIVFNAITAISQSVWKLKLQ